MNDEEIKKTLTEATMQQSEEMLERCENILIWARYHKNNKYLDNNVKNALENVFKKQNETITALKEAIKIMEMLAIQSNAEMNLLSNHTMK